MKKALYIIVLIPAIIALSGCGGQAGNSDSKGMQTEERSSVTQSTFNAEIVTTTENTTTSKKPDLNKITKNPFTVNIPYKDFQQPLYYTAPISGIYRFDMDINDVNDDYNLKIYSRKNVELADEDYSCYLHGVTVHLEKNEVYKIIITQKSGLPVCRIHIGIPTEQQNVADNIINGSIKYIEQQNSYCYKAPRTGYYRLDFDTNDVTCDYNVKVTNEKNEVLLEKKYSDYSNGENIELEASQNYYIYVIYDTGFPEYDIKIHVPQKPAMVKKNTFSGSTTFINQQNIYYYTAKKSGKYKISLSTDNTTSQCRLTVKNSKNEELLLLDYEGEEEIEMKKGQKYTFILSQTEGFLYYKVDIKDVK